MSTILHVDSSPSGDASVSRRLSREFVDNWKDANPEGKVIRRDLTTTSLTSIDAQWIGAAYARPDSLTAAQRERLALSDTLIAELRQADEFVFGVPMHNFSVPSVFRLWLDQVMRAGKTFAYVNGAPTGLLTGKKAHFIVASGGVYDTGSPAVSFDFVQPYLRTIFGFLGVTDTSFYNAGGVAAIGSGQLDRQAFLQRHIGSIREQFQAA